MAAQMPLIRPAVVAFADAFADTLVVFCGWEEGGGREGGRGGEGREGKGREEGRSGAARCCNLSCYMCGPVTSTGSP